jgi:fumarylacetoacetase
MNRSSAVDFPIEALPYGVVAHEGRERLVAAVGTDLIDLDEAADALSGAIDPSLMRSGGLDRLLAAGRPTWSAVRAALADALAGGRLDEFRRPVTRHAPRLAWHVADFVDFYSSMNHAGNVGRMFRPGRDPLPPNWRHLPVAYHGRSGTVVVDGTPVRRPRGQRRGRDGGVEFAASDRLDFEAELGWVLGGSTEPGQTVAPGDAAEHLFGLVLLNDWSARDLQSWESAPLGPFLSKSFATSVSAWVMPLEALEPARVPHPQQSDPPVLPHLALAADGAFDIDIEVWLRVAGGEAHMLSSMNAAGSLYWTAAQQLAHATSNGATVRPGDLFGTGTVSGVERNEWGSMLELSWNGAEPVRLGPALERTFLEDGDVVTLRGGFPGRHGRIPLGPVSGEVLPAPA